MDLLLDGSEFNSETVNEYKKKDKEEEAKYRLPFGGGSGAGVSINPVAFVVVQQDSIKIMPIDHSSAIDKLMDYVPDLMQKINKIIDKKCNCKNKDDLKKDNKEQKQQEDIEKKVEIEYKETIVPDEYLEDE